jgi:TM2 domain-containing membrane protein YozV
MIMAFKICSVWFVCLIAFTLPTLAQENAPLPDSTQKADTVQRKFVPLETIMNTVATSANAIANVFATSATMTKSPVLALVMSALVPGLGQFYVQSYWKAPLFVVGAGVAWGFVIAQGTSFGQVSRLYDALDATGQASALGNLYLRQREFYRDTRDVSILFVAGVSLLAAIDAYTGAHLFDFDVTDELKASLYLDLARGGIGVAVRF